MGIDKRVVASMTAGTANMEIDYWSNCKHESWIVDELIDVAHEKRKERVSCHSANLMGQLEGLVYIAIVTKKQQKVCKANEFLRSCTQVECSGWTLNWHLPVASPKLNCKTIVGCNSCQPAAFRSDHVNCKGRARPSRNSSQTIHILFINTIEMCRIMYCNIHK